MEREGKTGKAHWIWNTPFLSVTQNTNPDTQEPPGLRYAQA